MKQGRLQFRSRPHWITLLGFRCRGRSAFIQCGFSEPSKFSLEQVWGLPQTFDGGLFRGALPQLLIGETLVTGCPAAPMSYITKDPNCCHIPHKHVSPLEIES